MENKVIPVIIIRNLLQYGQPTDIELQFWVIFTSGSNRGKQLKTPFTEVFKSTLLWVAIQKDTVIETFFHIIF